MGEHHSTEVASWRNYLPRRAIDPTALNQVAAASIVAAKAMAKMTDASQEVRLQMQGTMRDIRLRRLGGDVCVLRVSLANSRRAIVTREAELEFDRLAGRT